MRFLCATLFTALSLSSAKPAPTFEDTDAIRIPLQRRDLVFRNPDGSANLPALRQEVQSTILKYTRNRAILQANGVRVTARSMDSSEDIEERSDFDSEREMKRSGPHEDGLDALMGMQKRSGTTSLYLANNYCYSAAVNIGTPAQLFNIYIDTGSADFTVGDVACTNCGTSKSLYKSTLSSTFLDSGRKVSSGFADGSSNIGYVGYDTFKLSGTTILNQTFIRASELASTLVSFPVDGMGMSYSSVGITGDTSVPFTSQTQGNGIYFGLRLSNVQGYSELSLGYADKLRIGGSLYAFQVIPDKSISGVRYSYWQIASSSAIVNQQVILTSPVTHILDSGSNFVFAPPADAAKFYAAVPGSAKLAGSSTYYTFPCASVPTVSFRFGTTRATWNNFTMSSDDFNLGYIDNARSVCIGAVVSQNLGLGGRWLLGSTFMKSWFIIHDMSKNMISLTLPKDRAAVTPGGL